MQYFIGFVIALFIALTGVGAGTVTGAGPGAVSRSSRAGSGWHRTNVCHRRQMILVPRRFCAATWRGARWLHASGWGAGCSAGSLFLKHLVTTGSQNLLNALLGAILVSTASWQIFNALRPAKENRDTRDRSALLSWLMFPVGAEVGFSSAGAGALGSAALLSLTPLAPAQIVGTGRPLRFLSFHL